MLVLSRKNGEQIVIGGNIIITVVTAASGRVRLGFTAPPEVSIMRKELHTKLREQESGDDSETLVSI